MNIKSKKLSFFGYRMFYENTKRLKMMKIETVNNKNINKIGDVANVSL